MTHEYAAQTDPIVVPKNDANIQTISDIEMMDVDELEKALAGEGEVPDFPWERRRQPRRDLPAIKRNRDIAFDATLTEDSIRHTPKVLRGDNDYDVEKEQNEFMDEIRRMSNTPVNFADLTFTDLDNPDLEFANVANRATGQNFPVKKSKIVMDQLKKKKTREPIDLKDASNLSPHLMRSGAERQMPAWQSFEQLKFNRF